MSRRAIPASADREGRRRSAAPGDASSDRLRAQDFVSFQNRMITVGSSVPGIPFTLVLETAIILPCQYGDDRGVLGGERLDLRAGRAVRAASVFAPSSALISFSIAGLL